MITNFNDFNELDTIDAPQADDLRKVYTVTSLIGGGSISSNSNNDQWLAEKMGVVDRQVRYYKSAARILGFLDAKDCLTQAGYNLLSFPGDFMDTMVIAFQYSNIGSLWCAYYQVNSVLDVPLDINNVIEFLDYAFGGNLSDATKRRRAQTLIKWVNEYKQHIHTR